MKKRRQIISLLKRYSGESDIRVVVRGHQTGAVLYEGSLWYVPFGCCIDYVLTYKYINKQLEIVSTCSPY